jgi:adenosylcobyric acid synthase
MTYEIHIGVTKLIEPSLPIEPLLQIQSNQNERNEGLKGDRVWGIYLHGLFESAAVRQALTELANISGHHSAAVSWQVHQANLYNQMADLLEANLDLTAIRRYLDI